MKVRSRKNLLKLAENALVINPFVSEEQRRACYAADDPRWDCREWEHATGDKKLPKRKAKITDNSRGLLKVDPTRTTTLRRQAVQEVRRRFARLQAAITKLVFHDDAFGLKAARNAFCPTGPGGGVDPSCSILEGRNAKKVLERDRQELTEEEEQVVRLYTAYQSQGNPLLEQGRDQQIVDKMSKIVESSLGFSSPVKVFRGVNLTEDQAMSFKDGKTVSLPSVTSTSLYEENAERFGNSGEGKQYIMQIYASRGLYAGVLSAYRESELILPKSDFDVISVKGNRISLRQKDKTVSNTFCPTGEGGGVDPSCSSSRFIKSDGTKYTSADIQSMGKRELKFLIDQQHEDAQFALKGLNDKGKRESLIRALEGENRKSATPKQPAESAIEKELKKMGEGKRIYIADLRDRLGKDYSHEEVSEALWSLANKGKLVMYELNDPREKYDIPEGSLTGSKTESRHTRSAVKTSTGAEKHIVYYDSTRNSFCPTGEGGGVDATCSPGKSTIGITLEKARSIMDTVPGAKWMREKLQVINDKLTERYGKKQALAIVASGQAFGWGLTAVGTAVTGVPVYVPFSTVVGMVPGAALAELYYRLKKDNSSVPVKNEESLSQEEIDRLGKELVEQLMYLWQSRKDATENAGQFQFHSTPQQIKAFQQWLQSQMAQTVLSGGEDGIWTAYAQAGYRKGQGRAFDDVRGGKDTGSTKPTGFMEGSRDEFLRSSFGQPVAVEKIKILAGRSFDDLENVTSDMSARMSRTLTDGLVTGANPRDIADDLADDLGISRYRAEGIAQTEIIRAHAEGQLDALENLGVQEVGVQVEFSTAGDGRVCPECESMDGEIYDIQEADGIIPLHIR